MDWKSYWHGVVIMVKLLVTCVLGLLALVAQIIAVRMLWRPAGSLDPLIVFFGWQVLAAIMAALFVLSALPRHYKQPGMGGFIHVFAICLFLPIAGQILFLSLIVVACMFPAADMPVDSITVENPKFVTYLVSRVSHGAGARLRARLENRNVPAGDRMAAMVAVRSLPSHITGGMLRDLLSDPTEEIRLLAYGVFDAAEKAIRQNIFLAQSQMEQVATISEKPAISSRLAELHWELIYQNLVHGEVERFTLERVKQYAHEALASNSGIAAMWYLLGRCALLDNDAHSAEEFLQRAQFNHFPVDRLLPWQAEAAFLKHDYCRIGEMLSPLDVRKTSSMLQPIVRYWSK